MPSLTSKQSDILDYIRLYLSSHGVTPTTRQIQTRFRFKSQTAAANHLNALERKGLVKKEGLRYGMTGPLVLWEDVLPLVLVQKGTFVREFYKKYPHLKP